jgi:hypothetical protein
LPTARLTGALGQADAGPKSTFHPFRFGNTPYLDKIRDRQKKTMTGPVSFAITATR